eukprot:CAMPEP_0179960186 /NCGR_PEP_ID=MMETSP0983-20121128/28981_1 /TAXON_ID=483367 /ORGANISM="non described non described, Strain CCMP 2436" /LENGTH=93 /DNA_ID=CAMNT_0021872469 /DNA_START=19 /DNA_END=298 /DNA_ORIENTATION=-
MTFSYPSIVLRRPLLLDAAKALLPRATCPVRTAAAQEHAQNSTAAREPDLKSIFEHLSAFLNIEKDVLHDFIAGLATSGLAGGGVAADPESAA